MDAGTSINPEIDRGKATGGFEPPFVLGLSVWAAIKHTLSFVQPGVTSRLDLPAMPERVLFETVRSGQSDQMPTTRKGQA